MRCWCGYLSGARCRLFAYGPADVADIPNPHHLLPHLNPEWFYLSGAGLYPEVVLEKRPLSGCGQWIGSSPSSAALALLVEVVVRPPSTEWHVNPVLWIKAKKADKNWLPQQHPSRDQKTNFRSFVHSPSSTNPANWVKIGPVDVEIIRLTEIVK